MTEPKYGGYTLEQLRALLEGACPAPWGWDQDEYAYLRPVVRGPGNEYILRINNIPGWKANRELTIAARNALPELLDALAVAGEKAGITQAE